MKRSFKVENLDCGNCGAKIEDQVSKLEGVNKVSLNFMSQRLVLDVEDNKFDSIIEEVKIICDKVEPGCTINA